ncbi:MAG: hypothetical protein P0S95_05950 [Rhabdochlamydiaceae bacterium]|nr:hypothetical protein [Candidatus Amphrikana amoebophyrae]
MAAVGSNSYSDNVILMEVDSKSTKTHLEVDPRDPTRLCIEAGEASGLSKDVFLLVKKSLSPTNHLYKALNAKYDLDGIQDKINEEYKAKFIPGYVKYEKSKETPDQTRLKAIFEAEAAKDWIEMGDGGALKKHSGINVQSMSYFARSSATSAVQAEINSHKLVYLIRIEREKSPQAIAFIKKYRSEISSFLVDCKEGKLLDKLNQKVQSHDLAAIKLFMSLFRK